MMVIVKCSLWKRTKLSRLLKRPLMNSRIDDDAGSALLLAIAFLFITSLVVLALISWSGNSLADTTSLNSSSSLEYASSGAVELEIQNLRYTYQAATSGAIACTPGGGSSYTLNSTSVSVYCVIVHNPYSASTRVVNLNSCSSATSQATCVASPYLKATVSFNDYNLSDQDQCTSTSNETSCGTAMAITGWTIT